jgi:hypothetical protein
MKHLRLLLAALAVLGPVAGARADFVTWTFSTSPTSSLPADSPGTGSIDLTGAAGTRTGPSQIVVASLKNTSSSSTLENMVTGGGYQIDVTITDSASNTSGTLTFLGKLTGVFFAGGTGLSNSFLSGTESLTLGGNVYDVSLSSYLPAGPASATLLGGIGATVSVNGEVPGGNPTPSSVSPEPGSLLLCGLGAAGFALAGWKRRRTLPHVSL